MAEYRLENSDLENKLFEDDSERIEQLQDEQNQSERELRAMYMNTAAGSNSLGTEPEFGEDAYEHVLFLAYDCFVYAMNERTGEVIWTFRTGGRITGRPAVHGDTLYVGSRDCCLYAINVRDGSERWHTRTGDAICVKPIVFGDFVIFGSLDKNVYAFSRDGRELWRRAMSGFTVVEPLYASGKIFIGATDGRLHALNLDGSEAWSHYAGSTSAGGAAFVPETGTIVFVSWDGYVFNSTVDGRILWKFKCDNTIPTRHRPFVENGVIYIGTGDLQSGGLYALDTNGKMLWKYQTNGRTQGPVVSDASVVCSSTDKNLYSLDKSGRLVWRFQADGSLLAPPAQHHGFIFQSAWSGHLYCLTMSGELVWKIFFPGQLADIKQLLAPVQRLSDKLRSFVRFWHAEKKPTLAYQTEHANPQVTLGSAAYRMSTAYKSEMTYEKGGPVGYEMNKKKDWRDQSQGRG